MPGLDEILSNPMLQGALSAYLAGIGSPKRGGWGGALSHGGAAGLSAYGQAKTAEEQKPLLAAQIAQSQAQVPHLKAETAHLGLADKQLQEEMDQRQKAAAQLDTDPRFAKMDPVQKFALQQGIREGHVDANSLGITPYQKAELGLKEKEVTAQLGHQKFEEGAKTKELGLEGEKVDIERKRASKRVLLIGPAGSAPIYIDPATDPIPPGYKPAEEMKIEKPTGKGPKTAADLEAQILKEGKEAYKARPMSDYRVTFEDFMARYRPEAMKRMMAEAGMGAAAPAATPTLGPGWKMGPPDEKGRPTAIDDKGVPHVYIPD